jgi:TonB-linked SusC/RagA family outer membrane protein
MTKVDTSIENAALQAGIKFLLLLAVLLGPVAVIQTQAKDLQQKVSIDYRNASADAVIKELNKQTAVSFTYDKAALENVKIPEVKFKDTPLGDVLNYLHDKDGLKFTVLPNTIVVQKVKEPSKEQKMGLANRQQVGSLIGRVTDEKGEPLIGATVRVVEINEGVSTNVEGAFSLSLKPGTYTVEVSYISYETQSKPGVTVQAGQATELSFSLKEASGRLQEVVVTALGIEREEKKLGYAQQTVNAEELSTAVANNWSSGLKGKVAGLNIISGGTGPINSQKIQLRGSTSLDPGENYALIVVDGVPMDQEITSNGYGSAAFGGDSPVDNGNAISDLNQDDIESVTVLKGPSAAALYGSRAANGALIITTKSGRRNQKLGLSYNTSVLFDVINKWPDYQFEYGQGSGSFFDQNGNPYYSFSNSEDGPATGNHPEAWGPKFDGQSYYQYDPATQSQGSERTLWRPYKDNRKDFFETGITFNNSISLQGGNENGSMRVNLSHSDNQWIVPNTGFKKNGVSLNGNYQISPRIKLSSAVNYNNRKSDNLPVLGYNNGSLAYFMMFLLPNVDIDWYKPIWQAEQENLVQLNPFSPWSSNPYFITYTDANTLNSHQIVGNVKTDVKLTEHLEFMGRVAMNSLTQFRETKRGFSSKRHAKGYYGRQDISSREINADFLLSYRNKIGEDFDYSIMGGGNQMTYEHKNVRSFVDALVAPETYKLSNGVNNPIVFPDDADKKVNSLYGMMSLGYRDLVFLDFTGRNDWSSTLPKENNSLFYPSVSSSFILSDILTLPHPVDYLKYRLSFAQVGSDTDPYLTAKYYAQSSFPGSAYVPTTFFNDHLKPEITSNWETGFEYKMLGNRIGFDLTLYTSDTKNQILVLPMDIAAGYRSRVINAGKVRNRGIEIGFNGVPVTKGNFQWDIAGNWTTNDNEVLELLDGVEKQLLASVVNGKLIATVGGTTTDIWGRSFVRDPEGNIVYSGGVPVLSAEDRYVGNATPDWKAGLTNTFNYKNLRFSFTVDGQYGGLVYSHTHHKATEAGQLAHTLAGREEGFIIGEGVVQNEVGEYSPNTEQIPVDDYYRKYYEYQNVESNTFDASFLKIREVSLSYSFPKTVLSNIGVGGLTLSMFGRELKTFSDFPIFDPETAAMNGEVIVPGMETGQMPSTASYGFNLKVDF